MFGDWSHWCILVGSHLIRFLAEDSGHRALRSEVAGLRVEVHRAKQLVADYNSVLNECEDELGWSRYIGKLVSTFNLVIGIVGVLIWIVNRAWGVLDQTDSLSRDNNFPLVTVKCQCQFELVAAPWGHLTLNEHRLDRHHGKNPQHTWPANPAPLPPWC